MGIAADAASVGVDGPLVVAALGDGAPALGLGGRREATPGDAEAASVAGAGLAGDPHAAIIEMTRIAAAIRLIELFVIMSFGRYDR